MAERYLSESSVLHAIGYVHPLDYNAQGIVERIRAIPAADVRPVVRGRWLNVGRHHEGESVKLSDGCPMMACCCSVCGEYLVGSDEYFCKGNFCPNCGADMREEQE